jgi:hypothetical protein
MEQMGLNCFSLNGLEGFLPLGIRPKQALGSLEFRVKSRLISGDFRRNPEETAAQKANVYR